MEENKEILETPQTEEKIEETYKEMSPIQLILRRFFRSKLSVVGIVMVVGLFIFSFLGPVIYNKWGETEVDKTPTMYVEENTYIVIDPVTQEKVEVVERLQLELSENAYDDPSLTHLLGTDDKWMCLLD